MTHCLIKAQTPPLGYHFADVKTFNKDVQSRQTAKIPNKISTFLYTFLNNDKMNENKRLEKIPDLPRKSDVKKEYVGSGQK